MNSEEIREIVKKEVAPMAADVAEIKAVLIKNGLIAKVAANRAWIKALTGAHGLIIGAFGLLWKMARGN
jgi:hypothetical protein